MLITRYAYSETVVFDNMYVFDADMLFDWLIPKTHQVNVSSEQSSEEFIVKTRYKKAKWKWNTGEATAGSALWVK